MKDVGNGKNLDKPANIAAKRGELNLLILE